MASRNLLDELPPNVKVKLRRSARPKWVAPMLATLVDEPFSRARWLFEPKLDGERCLALRSGRNIQLLSRNQKELNDKYPELLRAFRNQETERFAVDCEIVTFDGNVTSFASFNSACRSGIHPKNSVVKSRFGSMFSICCTWMVTTPADCLCTTGNSCCEKRLILPTRYVSPSIVRPKANAITRRRAEKGGKASWQKRPTACMSRRGPASGLSSSAPESRNSLSAGSRSQKATVWGLGRSGCAITRLGSWWMQARSARASTTKLCRGWGISSHNLKPGPGRLRSVIPHALAPTGSDRNLWLKSDLPSGRPKPSFDTHAYGDFGPNRGRRKSCGSSRLTGQGQTVQVNRHHVEITRPTKVLFPGDGITKADLIDYYRRIAPWILPYMRGRPLAMERYPDGIDKPSFFHKMVPSYYPDWIKTVTVNKAGGTVTHVICDNEATVVDLANQAYITPHG